jgi:hypothetical protein
MLLIIIMKTEMQMMRVRICVGIARSHWVSLVSPWIQRVATLPLMIIAELSQKMTMHQTSLSYKKLVDQHKATEESHTQI